MIYREWTETIASALARVEALIDFGEDEHIDLAVDSAIMTPIRQLTETIGAHLREAKRFE